MDHTSPYISSHWALGNDEMYFSNISVKVGQQIISTTEGHAQHFLQKLIPLFSVNY